MNRRRSARTAGAVRRQSTILALGMLTFGTIPGMAQEGFHLKGVIPDRDSRASPRLVDLSGYYTAPLDNDWLVSADVNLRTLPKGIRTFAGVQFDVRGIVQLASTELLSQSTLSDQEKTRQYPRAVEGIPVKLRAERIHFLQASAWGGGSGEKVGEYIIHYADGQKRSIPLLYQQSLIDWWVKDRDGRAEQRGDRVAWVAFKERSQPLQVHLDESVAADSDRQNRLRFGDDQSRAVPDRPDLRAGPGRS